MKILLLGSGGREHALAWKIAQSKKVEKLFIAPGNAGTALVGENVNIKADDFEALKNFCVDNGVDMTNKLGDTTSVYLNKGPREVGPGNRNGALSSHTVHQ